jgi:hypothetical protein
MVFIAFICIINKPLTKKTMKTTIKFSVLVTSAITIATLVTSCKKTEDFPSDSLPPQAQVSNSNDAQPNARTIGTDSYQTALIHNGNSLVYNFSQSTIQNQYILSLNARIVYGLLGGSQKLLQIKVNGQYLQQTNLINKAQVEDYTDPTYKYQFTYNDGRRFNWFANNSWELFYAPDLWENNTQIGSIYHVIGGQATDYEFDISSLLHSGSNTIEFIHNGSISNDIELAAIQVWNQVASTTDASISPSATRSLSFNIDNSSNNYIVRFFAKIDYSILAGAQYGMTAKLDNAYLMSVYDIANKPQVSNGYYSANPSTTYKTTFRSGNSYYLMDLTSKNLFLPYSPDFIANNLSGFSYYVIGGEAYKWCFKVPSQYNTVGNHSIVLTNTMGGNYSESIRRFAIYKLYSLL